ncbi:hypothetical protein GH741_14905 [Aquibacillus halophilus]|uniref:O-antigen ligase domain-containing protein n=1 Tax=Aquibacillus halophilus TaxID=930132 RepID=A0A6A8DFC5_9BACI|nr:hypothetical protein [Aquibacillus halophilus]MRH43930.1 hypothetical protein [Aquibacillus halophilus]
MNGKVNIKLDSLQYYCIQALIIISSFYVVESYSPREIIFTFSLPQRVFQIIFLLLMVWSIIKALIDRSEKERSKIDNLTAIYLTIFVLSMILFIIKMPLTPDVYGGKYSKEFFMLSAVVFNLIVTSLFFYFNSIPLDKMKKLARLFVNCGIFHAFLAIILYLLYFLNINKLSIGVDIGYSFPRLQGFTNEPSFYSIYILSIILLKLYLDRYKWNWSTLFLILTFVLSFSSTGLVLLGAILIAILFLFKFKYKLILIAGMGVSVIVSFFIEKLNFLYYRVYEHIMVLLTNGNFYTRYNAPRAHEILNEFNQLVQLDWILGNGFGSDIYYGGSVVDGIINIYTRMMFEGGIITIFLIALFTFFIFYVTRKQKLLLIMALITLLYLNMNNPGMLVFQYLLLGFAYYLSKKDNTDRSSLAKNEDTPPIEFK